VNILTHFWIQNIIEHYCRHSTDII